MKRNSIRVVCNPYTNKMSYYFKNELGEWNVLSESSPLSRQYYTNTSIMERGAEILKVIDEIYNRKNRGVDILFEGTSDSFGCFTDEIKRNYADRDIRCTLGTTKIAVIGKVGVGKTTLIDGLERLKGFNYTKIQKDAYVEYADDCNHAKWYEIKGLDLNEESVDKLFQTVDTLYEEGLSAVIYCVSANTGRIENAEERIISRIENDYAKLKVMVALTMCYKDDVQETVDEIERITNQVKLVLTLAKEYKTAMKDQEGDSIIIESFGLEDVSGYVFEGR